LHLSLFSNLINNFCASTPYESIECTTVHCFSVDDSSCVDNSTYYCQQQYHHHPSRHVVTSLFATGHVTDDVTLDAPPCPMYVYGGVEGTHVCTGACASACVDADVYYPPSQQHCIVTTGRN